VGKLTPGWLATWSLEDKEEQSWFKVPVGQGLVVRVTGVTGLEGWLHREDWCRVLKSRFLVLKAIGSFSRRFTSFIRRLGPLSHPLAVFFSGWAGTIPDRERKSFRLQVRDSTSGHKAWIAVCTSCSGRTPRSFVLGRKERGGAVYVTPRANSTPSGSVQEGCGEAIYVVPKTNFTPNVFSAGRVWEFSFTSCSGRGFL